MHSIDIVIFLSYLLGITLFGSSFFRKNKTESAFTLGSNRIPNWVITMSIFATFVSSISFLALPGNAFLGNWNAFVFSLSIPIAMVIAALYFVPLYRKINSPSAYTFIEQRFGSWARIYVSACYLLTQITRVGTILYLLALTLNAVVGWDMVTIIVLTGIIITIYSLAGGFEAVVWTDAIQGIVLVAGAILTVVFICLKMPEGASQIFSIANEHQKFSLGSFGLSLSESTFWVVLIYGLFINLQNYGIDQNYVQRYMAAKTVAEAQRSAFWGGMIYLPVSALLLFIGTALFSYYHSIGADLPADVVGAADKIFPYFIVHSLPVGVTGILIASIFSAGMSTISTSFNSSATVFLTDYYKPYKKGLVTEKQALRVLHITSIIISILGISVALAMINVKSALDAWWKMASIFSGGMLGLFLLAAFAKNVQSMAAIVGVILGILLLFWLSLSPLITPEAPWASPFHSYLSIVFGTSAIFLVGFLVSALLNSAIAKARG